MDDDDDINLTTDDDDINLTTDDDDINLTIDDDDDVNLTIDDDDINLTIDGTIYIPHSIFHLAWLLYVRPEMFEPCYTHGKRKGPSGVSICINIYKY
jgi:hypothetical protein